MHPEVLSQVAPEPEHRSAGGSEPATSGAAVVSIDDRSSGRTAEFPVDASRDEPGVAAAVEPDEFLDRDGEGHPDDLVGGSSEEATEGTRDETSVGGTASNQHAISPRDKAIGHPLVKSLIRDPEHWRLWPAVAVLRWMERKLLSKGRGLTYRSHPALCFAGSEISDIRFMPEHVAIVLNAVGLACAGSPLPTSEIARIIADTRNDGALNEWLDGICDRFMHALERMQSQCHSAFAIATGGTIEAHALVAELAGRTTPLNATPDGTIFHGPDPVPEGAVGLAGMFVGVPSARGIEALFAAFTGLDVRAREFAGAEMDVARPARLGGKIGKLLGRRCRPPEAGVEVHLEGGRDDDARKWVCDRTRRQSLHTLAMTYVGSGTPAVRFVLWLDPECVPEGRLDGTLALGGMAVLGSATKRIALPIEISG